MEHDTQLKDVDKRVKALRQMCDLLREHLHRAQGSASGGGGRRRSGALSENDVIKAASYVKKLAAALDRSLDQQQAAVLAHSACIVRDRRVADKLNDCVGCLMSTGALAQGLASTKPYSRQQQTIHL